MASSLTLEQRKAAAVMGAQYSATLERWVGWLFDGNYTTTFDPRTNRERALQDARDHYERIFHPERALKKWDSTHAMMDACPSSSP